MKQFILAGIIAGTLISCGPSTKVEKSWQEPGSSVSMSSSSKFLIIGMVKDESSRRIIEDELAKRLKGKGIASYTVIVEGDLKEGSEALLNQKLKDGQYTHILLMRLADIEKETSYVQGTTSGYYGGYGRYYGYGAGTYSTPGYYQTDKNYFIETAVYSISPEKLLYTVTTKTVNPDKILKAVNEIADVVADKMKKDGFVKP